MSGVTHRGGLDIVALRHKLESATGGELRRAMSDALGTRAQQLVYKGFRESKAPDGTPWAPVKRLRKLRRGHFGPARSGKPLVDTGNLRQSVVMQSGEGGFRVEITAPYAKYQQDGTRGHRSRVRALLGRLGVQRFKGGITPRPMVPRDARDLNPIWMPAFKQTARQIIRRRLAA